MKLKQYNEAEINAVRWINKEGKALWAVEVTVTHEKGGKPTYYRADKLVSGMNFRNIGRLIMKIAGYEVEDRYTDFRKYAPMCGNFVDGTKREALESIKKTWTCWNGSTPDIQTISLPLVA